MTRLNVALARRCTSWAALWLAATSSAWALAPASQIGWRLDASGAATQMQLTLETQVPAADQGQLARHFVAATVAGQWYCFSGQWVPCGSSFPSYAQGALPAQLSQPLGSVDTQSLRGAMVYAGYGSSFDEMIESRRYRQVYTLGAASGIAWQPTETVPNTAPAFFSFNATAIALRDAADTLHLVWDDGSNGWHGRHNGSAWQVSALPKLGQGKYSKPTIASLPDGELMLVWSESSKDMVTINVSRSRSGRTEWDIPLTVASGSGLQGATSLSAFAGEQGRGGALVAWTDDVAHQIFTRSWAGTGWALSDWSNPNSPASAQAVPKDAAVGGSGLVQWAAWEDTRGGGASEIYLAKSVDGGRTWGSEQRLPALAGSAIGGDPSVTVLADSSLMLAFQRQSQVFTALSSDEARTLTRTQNLGPGLFAHLASNSRSAIAVSWEYFGTGNLLDDSNKTAGNAISIDQWSSVDSPHAMPDSATTLGAVQAAVALSHDRIDVFWVDVSVVGQRSIRWRSGRFTD